MKTSNLFKSGLTITILLIFISSALAGQKTEKVDRLFAQWNTPDSPGCALAIVKDGRIIYKKGYGMANLELNVPITPHTVFYIGSCSKQFVAFCIALLAQQKRLSIDDDIRKYLPEM
ncbi:MAG: serine hydrolase domain-containing protein, partial [Candidatus Aminicenantales bacterium]